MNSTQLKPNLCEIFEPGQEVFWLAHTSPDGTGQPVEARVPAEVVSIDREGGLIKLIIPKIHGIVPFWVGAGSVRAKCIECRFCAAMPYSQTCAGCWNWKEELSQEEQEGARAVERRMRRLEKLMGEGLLCQE